MGRNIQSYESVALVEEYRQYWKPNKTKVILLAESHVFTRDEDRLITLPELPHLPGYPTQYAKFVYCLAYGERQLTGNESHPQRDGTPQFWKIFYSCNNRISDLSDFRPILSKTNYKQRIKNKIELLLRLRQRGVMAGRFKYSCSIRQREKTREQNHVINHKTVVGELYARRN